MKSYIDSGFEVFESGGYWWAESEESIRRQVSAPREIRGPFYSEAELQLVLGDQMAANRAAAEEALLREQEGEPDYSEYHDYPYRVRRAA